jgi:signal-transduction protein with cAMP-binding, CBS, and nucleotidyltransferase domain
MRFINAKSFTSAGAGALVRAAAAAARYGWSKVDQQALRVADAMTGSTARVDQRSSARDAATRMAEEGVGALAVCGSRGEPVGVITDRDLVVRLIAQNDDPRSTSVADCLEGEAATIEADASLDEAAASMRSQAVRHLPVLRDGRLVGMLTVADIAEHDQTAAASVHRALRRQPSDTRSAAWLLRKPYRHGDEHELGAARRESRVAEGQLAEAARTLLADRDANQAATQRRRR